MTNYVVGLKDKFISAFEEKLVHFKNENDFNLNSKLVNNSNTTSFYKKDLFPSIAKELKLECSKTEFLRIDIFLYKKGRNGWLVPMLAIETENDSKGDLENEIDKLLCINAPIKVLLTRTSLKKLIESRANSHEDTPWYYLLEDYKIEDRLNCYFIIISLEFNDNIPHYLIAIYNQNNLLETPELVTIQL